MEITVAPDLESSDRNRKPAAPPSPPRSASPEDADRDIEASRRTFLPGETKAWLVAVTRLDPLSLETDHEAMRAQALGEVTELMESLDDENRFMKVLQGTTLYRDLTSSPGFREVLRGLRTGQPLDATTIFEDMRDTLAAMRRSVELAHVAARNQDGRAPSQRESAAVHSDLLSAIDDTANSVAALALDQPASSRYGSTAAAFSLTALPFLQGYYTDPRSDYFLLQAARSFSRVAGVAAGLAAYKGTRGRDVTNFLLQRYLLWISSFILYAVPIFGPRLVPGFKDTGKAWMDSYVALGVNSALQFFISFIPDQGTMAMNAAQKTPGLATSRYARGQLEIREDDSGDDLQGEGGLELTGGDQGDPMQGRMIELMHWFQEDLAIIKAAREAYSGGRQLSTTQSEQLRLLNVDTAQLGYKLKLVIPGFSQGLQQLMDSAGDDAGPDSTKTDKIKYVAGGSMFVAATAISGVATWAASKEFILLSEYIPGYLSALFQLLWRIGRAEYTLDDVVNMFGNYFGGTLIAMPAILPNTFLNGIYDLSNPANQTIEERPGHKVPLEGRTIAWGVAAVYLILLMWLYSGRVGRDIAFLTTLALKMVRGNDAGSDQNTSNGNGQDEENARRLARRVLIDAATIEETNEPATATTDEPASETAGGVASEPPTLDPQDFTTDADDYFRSRGRSGT
jgi:hypothetical protein